MASSYKQSGVFSVAREFREYLVRFDGEDHRFHNKRLAKLAAKAARESYPDVKLIEKTTIRERVGREYYPDRHFEIDITNQIDY